MSEYKYMKEDPDYDYIKECDCCQSEVPLREFDVQHHKKEQLGDKKFLCKICAETFIGNSYTYPQQYDRKTMQAMAQVGNILLDSIEQRKPNNE